MHDQELEQVLRDGLAARAEEADTTAPVADRARADVGRRRRTRWGVVAAAAAVATIVAGTSVVALTGDEPMDTLEDEVAGDPADGGDQWRTEYWRGVAVDVPADWGFGGAPSERGRIACYPAPMVTADGQWLAQLESESESEVPGYVGRPIMLTDDCVSYPRGWEPTAPYVWLGAGVEPGTIEYPNGYVQETVEVVGTTITVGSDSPQLRGQILDSIDGGELCGGNLPLAEHGRITPTGVDAAKPGVKAESLRVCAYRAADDRSEAFLTYAADLGAEALADYQGALDNAARGWIDGCPTLDYAGNSWVVLEVVDAEGAALRQDVVSTQCGLSVTTGAATLSGRRGQAFELSPALVQPWARGGIAATVPGYVLTRRNYWVYDYFIGPQG